VRETRPGDRATSPPLLGTPPGSGPDASQAVAGQARGMHLNRPTTWPPSLSTDRLRSFPRTAELLNDMVCAALAASGRWLNNHPVEGSK
jgi:hypothetical protein